MVWLRGSPIVFYMGKSSGGDCERRFAGLPALEKKHPWQCLDYPEVLAAMQTVCTCDQANVNRRPTRERPSLVDTTQ